MDENLRTCLVTGWSGVQFAEIAAHTLPLMHRYAQRHGHQLAAVNLIGTRPASWMKVEAMATVLQTHDVAVWMDADVVVLDGSRWIGDELRPEAWHALVEHETECGAVPNCGVWVLRREMLPVLDQVWSMRQYLSHPWWEQAAVLELMGYHVTDNPEAKRERPSDLYDRTQFLGHEWNDHPRDAARSEHARLVHVTQYADRLATVKRYAAIAT